jgi:hypothetical protein
MQRRSAGPPVGTTRAGGPDGANRSFAPGRVACHLAGAAIFLVALVGDLAHGWRATGDDAIIAQRSWSVFSSHPPLIGQFSQGSAGPGHTFYDPGPLLFWILATPVRLDPVHGVLWGAALLCWAGIALAIEAAWAFRGLVASGVVVVCIAVVACTQSFVVVNPVWNPSIGVVWFIATIAAAATVASGRLRWWPALVMAASITAQSHLEFASIAVGLVLVGLAMGLLQRSGGPEVRWLVAGVGVGALCWVAPVVQEFTGKPGNLTVGWEYLRGRSTLGTRFGLQSLASVTGLRPLWLSRQNRGPSATAFLVLLSHINDRSEAFGLVVLASLVAIAVVSWWARRRDLATLATLALVVSAISVWTFSSLPQASVLTLVYSDIVLWPVGMLVWLVWFWTTCALGAALVPVLMGVGHRLAGHSAGAPAGASTVEPAGGSQDLAPRGVERRRSGALWLAGFGVLAVGSVGAIVAATTIATPHLEVPGGWSAVALVPKAATAVTRSHPTGPIAVYVDGPDSDFDYGLAYGVIWTLRQSGRNVSAPDPHWQPLGPSAKPATHASELRLTVRDGRVIVSNGR